MSTETENNSRLTDRLRDIEALLGRTSRYVPRQVKAALVGAAIGTAMVGLAFLYEQRAPADPQIPPLYDQRRIVEGNEFTRNHALVIVAIFAGVAVIFDRATPWLNRKLEEFKAAE